MDLQEVGSGVMNWFDLAKDRDGWRVRMNAVKNFPVRINAGNFLFSWKPDSFSRGTMLHGVRKCVLIYIHKSHSLSGEYYKIHP